MDKSTCRYCGLEIGWVRLISGKLAPVDPRAEEVDGKKLLIFPDGVTARRHLGFESGYTNHHATCQGWQRILRERKAVNAGRG